MDIDSKDALARMLQENGTDGIINELIAILMELEGSTASKAGAKAFLQSSLDDA